MKVELVAGVTPVSVGSVEQTARELIAAGRGANAAPDLGTHVAAREAAEQAHRAHAALVAVVRHPAADPALLLGVLVAIEAPVGRHGAAALRVHLAAEPGSDVRDIVEGRGPRGYPVLFAERVVSAEQLRAGEPFDCQLQAVVADPDRPRIAVFTLSSPTGRGWLDLSGVFGRLVASVEFAVD